MQLPPGLEHPSAELHEEWLIYMQLPPGLEHPSAELHEEWLIYIYIYIYTTKSCSLSFQPASILGEHE